MKFILCPKCCETIDSESINNGPKHRNPFKRRIIQCDNCGEFLQTKWLSFFICWVLIVSVPFAVVHLDVIAMVVSGVSASVLYLLMAEGYSYQPLGKTEQDSVEDDR